LFFILPRYTFLKILFTSENQDLFYEFIEIPCTTYTFTVDTVNITFILETNGLQKNVTFWLDAGVSAGKFKIGRFWTTRHITLSSIMIIPIPDS
jgi:hypothetical protein